MSFNLKIRLLQVAVQFIGLYGIYFCISNSVPYWGIAVAVMYFVYGPFNIGVTLHRLLTHRSFNTSKLTENILTVLSVFSTVGPSLTWVGIHRYHHAHADTPQDPHTPYDSTGKLTIAQWCGAWLGYKWYIPTIPAKYVKDLIKLSVHRFVLDNYFKITFAYIAILMLISPTVALVVYFIPCALCFHGVNLTNMFAHSQGYRNYDTKDHSTNSIVAQLLSLEGWHNNHHYDPSNPTIKHKWWEIDPLYWIIKILPKS